MNIIKAVFATQLVIMTGCALSPQTVSIAPEIQVAPASNEQLQRTIQIIVTDARTNKVIGTRGGVYKETSEITADGNISQAVQNSLTGALRVLGYSVSNNPADVTLSVDITDLKYNATGQPTITAIETSAALKATCRNDNQVVTNEYRITDKAEVLKAPTSSGNQKMINSTLSSTLQRLFNDRNMLDCINR